MAVSSAKSAIEPLNVFNDPEDSDIIIEFGEHKVTAHRIILRMWSPYFNRALKSQFSVAKSPVFRFDEEDDAGAIYAMLRHMYNMPYSEHPLNPSPIEKTINHHVKVFQVADKYDCPSLRDLAQLKFKDEAGRLLETGAIPLLTGYIVQFCGPDAAHLADSSLRNHLLEICINSFGRLSNDKIFQSQLQRGRLFDIEASTKILAKVGSRVQDESQSSKRRRVNEVRDTASVWSQIPKRWTSQEGQYSG